jgi:hypothetical protein
VVVTVIIKGLELWAWGVLSWGLGIEVQRLVFIFIGRVGGGEVGADSRFER